ncbi:hypothetical protein WJX72_001393 [[Myrmecia] bisecta]|uniref:Nudix hydrolase domain-containing protein n=1 Tax=[Myrmecia] bisecta TaxID=41462 RepID=A0AAW1Q516_9CHLO
MVADNESELFDVVDNNNVVIGQEHRSKVHATGLLHRAVYCFVFSPCGELLLQRRSPRKKIGPLQWDLSVAEHLQPGETYKQGAARGLQEELGIAVSESRLQGPLTPTHLRRLDIPGLIHDYEFVESYRIDGWDGAITADPEEVDEVRYVTLADARREAAAAPDHFTDWFHGEMSALNWFGMTHPEPPDRSFVLSAPALAPGYVALQASERFEQRQNSCQEKLSWVPGGKYFRLGSLYEQGLAA